MIINQIVKGSGGGSATKYGATIDVFLGDVDTNGALQYPSSTTQNLSFNGVVRMAQTTNNYGVMMNKFRNSQAIGSVVFPDLEQVGSKNALQYCFAGSSITSLEMLKQCSVSGEAALQYTCSSCPNLTSIVSKIISISGTNSLNCFALGSGLITADFSWLETVSGSAGIAEAFQQCSNLETLKLDSLVSITNNSGATQIAYQCPKLTTVNVDNLKTLSGPWAISGGFVSCTSLVSFYYKSLDNITGSNSLNNTFQNCTSLQSLWFYALTPNSFGSYTNQFNSMLSGVTGCTVHFPMAIQSTIGSWSSVTGGFGGTNTTVLFDIVTSLTGADGNTYTRQEKDSTTTATAWVYNDTLYYTSGVSDNDNGVNEPAVSDAIYSDAACTQSVTTITAIA